MTGGIQNTQFDPRLTLPRRPSVDAERPDNTIEGLVKGLLKWKLVWLTTGLIPEWEYTFIGLGEILSPRWCRERGIR